MSQMCIFFTSQYITFLKAEMNRVVIKGTLQGVEAHSTTVFREEHRTHVLLVAVLLLGSHNPIVLLLLIMMH